MASTALPTPAQAAETVDHTVVTAVEWNEAVLVRRLAEVERFAPEVAEIVREGIEALPRGAARDDKVCAAIGKLVAMLIAEEDAAA